MPWPPGRMSQGGRKRRAPHLHLPRGPWATPGTREAGSGRWWTREAGSGLPRSEAGQWKAEAGQGAPRQFLPVSSTAGSDLGSAPGAETVGSPTPPSPRGPGTPDHLRPDLLVPGLRRSPCHPRGCDPGRFPRICGRRAPTSAGGLGEVVGVSAPPPPPAHRSVVELTWREILQAPATRRSCRGGASTR